MSSSSSSVTRSAINPYTSSSSSSTTAASSQASFQPIEPLTVSTCSSCSSSSSAALPQKEEGIENLRPLPTPEEPLLPFDLDSQKLALSFFFHNCSRVARNIFDAEKGLASLDLGVQFSSIRTMENELQGILDTKITTIWKKLSQLETDAEQVLSTVQEPLIKNTFREHLLSLKGRVTQLEKSTQSTLNARAGTTALLEDLKKAWDESRKDETPLEAQLENLENLKTKVAAFAARPKLSLSDEQRFDSLCLLHEISKKITALLTQQAKLLTKQLTALWDSSFYVQVANDQEKPVFMESLQVHFDALPTKIKNIIYGMIWERSDKSSNDPNFGKNNLFTDLPRFEKILESFAEFPSDNSEYMLSQIYDIIQQAIGEENSDQKERYCKNISIALSKLPQELNWALDTKIWELAEKPNIPDFGKNNRFNNLPRLLEAVWSLDIFQAMIEKQEREAQKQREWQEAAAAQYQPEEEKKYQLEGDEVEVREFSPPRSPSTHQQDDAEYALTLQTAEFTNDAEAKRPEAEEKAHDL